MCLCDSMCESLGVCECECVCVSVYVRLLFVNVFVRESMCIYVSVLCM